MLLAGDIGGTKARLAAIAADRGPRDPVVTATYASADFEGLGAVVRRFIEDTGIQVERACVGAAGPVVNNTVTTTNLPWLLDGDALARSLGLESFRLINDLEAAANGVLELLPTDVHTLNAGSPAPRGALGIIAPGTGLGEAYLCWDGSGYRAHPSEGGHTDFGPIGELQIGLLRYLTTRQEHVSYERVCSGLAIPDIYAYLRDSGYAPEHPDLAREVAAARDATPVIARWALDIGEPSALCLGTLRTFVAILGAEASNLALKVLATGGVYLAGGIPLRILPLLREEAFLQAFRSKGRLRELLSCIPVHVVTYPDVALLGAAHVGLEEASAASHPTGDL
jgi:glucokinase